MAVPGFDQAMQNVADSARRSNADRDETRRLLYMALLAPRTKRYNLAGTLVNALKHHHGASDISVEEITDHVVSAIEGGDGSEAAGEWLQQQIDRITADLGD